MIGNDAFQEVDVVGITRPCTKHNYLVRDVKDIALIMKEAFFIARNGRPGPVLVDLPEDVQSRSTPSCIRTRWRSAATSRHQGHPRQIEKGGGRDRTVPEAGVLRRGRCPMVWARRPN